MSRIKKFVLGKIVEILDSDEFKNILSSKVYEYASIAALEMKESDVLIVPESFTPEQLQVLLEVVRVAGGSAVVAVNKDDIGIVRILGYGRD